MKLFSKYNLWSLFAAGVAFLITVVALYFIFQAVLIHQLDKSLLGERDEVLEYIHKNNALPETKKVYDERTVFEEEKEHYEKFKFRTKEKEINSDKHELVRAIYFGVDLNNKHYRVTVMRSLNETNKLLLYIVMIAVSAVLLLLFLIFIINRILVKKLLRPFYKTLNSIELYNLAERQSLQLDKVPIYEFNLLNEKLNLFSDRIISDYLALKDFSAHAAHEMQTPLAIIRTHTDQLLQNETLSDNEINSLQKIEVTVTQLSRLNHSLLLLAKLETNPFSEKTKLAIDETITSKCVELADFIEARNINVIKSIEPLSIEINEQLWEIICNNLFINAIKYNIDAGKIVITVADQKFQIRNTSFLPALDTNQLFNRFYRHPASPPEGTGLGLAIVKQAVSIAGFKIHYHYEDELHIYTIDFS